MVAYSSVTTKWLVMHPTFDIFLEFGFFFLTTSALQFSLIKPEWLNEISKETKIWMILETLRNSTCKRKEMNAVSPWILRTMSSDEIYISFTYISVEEKLIPTWF